MSVPCGVLMRAPRSSLGKPPKLIAPNCVELLPGTAWPCSVHGLLAFDMPYRNFPRRSSTVKQLASGSMMMISLLGKTAMLQPGLTWRRTRRPSLWRSTGAPDESSESSDDWVLSEGPLPLGKVSVWTSFEGFTDELSLESCFRRWNLLGGCSSWIMRMSVCTKELFKKINKNQLSSTSKYIPFMSVWHLNSCKPKISYFKNIYI